MNRARTLVILSGLLVATWWPLVSVCGQSGRRLEGRILDETGAPIPGATATLYSDDRVRATKADGDGNFVFVGLTASVHYVEASSAGFFSSSIPITDNTPEQLSVTLHVGFCTNCSVLSDVRVRSVSYEERSGREQLTGSVGEFSGPLLPNTSLTLMRADLDTTEGSWAARRGPALKERSFHYVFVTKIVSNAHGEFQLSGLEPGWYSLEALRDGYDAEIAKFWIARETLTEPSRIELVRAGPGQASPFRPANEIPLAPAYLPEVPRISAQQ